MTTMAPMSSVTAMGVVGVVAPMVVSSVLVSLVMCVLGLMTGTGITCTHVFSLPRSKYPLGV